MTAIKKTALILGSDSDLPTAQKAMAVLDTLGLPYELRVLSAHRTPEALADFARSAVKNGFGVIIAFAGKAAALAGVLAAHSSLPVIGVPIKSPDLGGLDALLSTVQMPSGVPVATVAIDGGANAAYLAARILALCSEELAQGLARHSQEQADRVAEKDANLRAMYKSGGSRA